MSTAEPSTPRLEPKPSLVDETRFVPDHLVDAFAVTDPALVRKLKAEREDTGFDRRDEMWEGIYVKSPDPNNEHEDIASELIIVFGTVREEVGGGAIRAGGNISDRVQGWLKNYRIPDVAAYLRGNPATNCGTHMVGGPDFAVEILSSGDLARKKLDFCAKVNTRELLQLDRDPWALELYRFGDGRLDLVDVTKPDKSEVLTSQILPLSFRLVTGEERPILELSSLRDGQIWRI